MTDIIIVDNISTITSVEESITVIQAIDVGPQGIQGDVGPGATIEIGNVLTIESTQPATVTNSGTITNAILNFSIPKGVKGDSGVPIQISAIFNDLSPILIKSLKAGSTLISGSVCILEEFDGMNASLSVGVDGDESKFIGMNDLNIINKTTNIIAINQQIDVDMNLKLFISPGFLATKGKVFIRIEVNEVE